MFVLSAAVLQDDPDVGVLMDFGQVQHVVQGQHSRRGLGKVHCWVDMVSKSQHFVVLGIHGFSLLSTAPRDVAWVRLCIKCDPSQFKYDVSLSLVIGVHLGHHPFFQKVKGQNLQDIQLMGHLSFDWAVPSDHMIQDYGPKVLLCKCIGHILSLVLGSLQEKRVNQCNGVGLNLLVGDLEMSCPTVISSAIFWYRLWLFKTMLSRIARDL